MIAARLIMTYNFDKDENGEPKEEALGMIALAALPSIGHLISVLRKNEIEADVCRVTRVIHYAIPLPIEPSDMPSLDRKEPSITIIAEYAPLAA